MHTLIIQFLFWITDFDVLGISIGFIATINFILLCFKIQKHAQHSSRAVINVNLPDNYFVYGGNSTKDYYSLFNCKYTPMLFLNNQILLKFFFYLSYNQIACPALNAISRFGQVYKIVRFKRADSISLKTWILTSYVGFGG